MDNDSNIDDDYDLIFKGLTDLNQRVRALFKKDHLADITLTFPGSDISFDAHSLILAIKSPVFEGILYGPMRTDSRNVELYDDPLIMEYVIAYCYGVNNLKITDIDTALELYKLADKYMIDELKKECGKHIVGHMNADKIKSVIGFAESFDFNDLKSYCLPYLEKKFDDKDESKYPITSVMLMDLKDDWIDILLPNVAIKVLDYRESWKHPECPLNSTRLSTILSGKCQLDQFYGCINAGNIHQFPLEHTGRSSKTFELCLSVTDPYHAKSVIEAINEQNRFEKHLIAMHIPCQEVWPSDWAPIPVERTHRPSMLLISNADDNKTGWVVEAAKALLPHSEGSYNKKFRKYGDVSGEPVLVKTIEPVNILKLPKSKLTLDGLCAVMRGLYDAGVKLEKIVFQSSCIENRSRTFASSINVQINQHLIDTDLFINVFEDFPIREQTQKTHGKSIINGPAKPLFFDFSSSPNFNFY